MRLTSDIVVKRLFCFRDVVVCTQLQQTIEAGGQGDAHDPLFLFGNQRSVYKLKIRMLIRQDDVDRTAVFSYWT